MDEKLDEKFMGGDLANKFNWDYLQGILKLQFWNQWKRLD